MTISAPIELPTATAVPKQRNITKIVVATSIGNALEWFDISVYAYFAVYVSKAFFPSSDQTISLLLTFGTFGLSFLIRPIGGILLGAYADRHGGARDHDLARQLCLDRRSCAWILSDHDMCA